MAETKREKVLFKYHSNVLDELTTETMWSEMVDKKNGIYRLKDIPFYGPVIATEDEFYAEFDESEQMLIYKETTKFSGNSIVLVAITQNGFDKEIIRKKLDKLNCKSESLNDSYFSLEILKKTNYFIITKILSEYQKTGILDYAEPCLSEKHEIDLIENEA